MLLSLFIENCRCRSPLSTPRARSRTRTEGDSFHEANSGKDAGSGEASNPADGASCPSASAAAGAAAAAAGLAAATVGPEPVKRQRGRFKLRDIVEVSSTTVPPSGSGGGGLGCIGGQQQQQQGAAAGPLGPAPVSSVSAESSSGTGVAAPAAAQFAQLDVKATMLLLVEQNRQMLERLAAFLPDHSSAAGPSPISAAPYIGASAASSLPTENRQSFANNHPLGADRGRTVSLSALTLQTPLPPKPPSYGGISADRNVSPLMRDTPASWWGAQQGQAQAQGVQSGVTQGGQPPRRPSNAGLAGRNSSDVALGGPAAPGGGAGLQGVGGGGVGVAGSGGVTTMSGSAARAKDDGTGRRAERGRLSNLLDQLKDEIEYHANARRDMDLELKRVSSLCVWAPSVTRDYR